MALTRDRRYRTAYVDPRAVEVAKIGVHARTLRTESLADVASHATAAGGCTLRVPPAVPPASSARAGGGALIRIQAESTTTELPLVELFVGHDLISRQGRAPCLEDCELKCLDAAGCSL